VTLPDERVYEMLQNDFVLGWSNNQREEYTGSSRGYHKQQTAIGTTNGAGGHNVQIFVLSADKVVMHALPGFWHPDDFVSELRFAQVMHRLWRDDSRSLGEKWTMFRRLHEARLKRPSPATTARSCWQGFDFRTELQRIAGGESRDTAVVHYGAQPTAKPINVLVHERLAMHPFEPFEAFDVGSFVDYGQRYYDNNRGYDKKSRRFRTAERLALVRAHREAREKRRR